MGSNSFLGVLTLLIFFGLINSSLNERNRRASDDTYGYIKITTAREIGRSSINIALKKLSDSSSITSVSGTLDGGSYIVSLTRADSIMNITSTSRFNDSTYRIISKLLVYPKPFPKDSAAVSLHVNSIGMKMNGTPLIDGLNYDINGENPSETGSVAGIAVLSKTDSTNLAKFGGYINGSQDIVVNPGLPDPDAFVAEYMASAHYVLTPGGSPYSGNTSYGSPTEPKIVFIDGRDSTHPVKISGGIQGWGILVVRGFFQLTGTMDWHGLVVVSSSSVFDFSLAKGTPRIIGSLLMGGPAGSTLEMRGTSKILYSSEALRQSQWIGKLLAYHILDWYE
ncbi:MAG: hypothetical protein HZB59_02500 [Ignavibacteriales bacterium]|nr:hypothetical protein [Ignavibacteriales bacterium]